MERPLLVLQVFGDSRPALELGLLDLLLVGALISLILISLVGNCLVCVAIFTDRRLRKLGNAFIVSLAIADLFVSCLVMTFALCNDLMNYWIFGDWFCDIWISFDIMCCTASILNLCAISLDRFIHIKDCLLYNQWMTRKVAISAVIIIWFISALVSFLPINLGWHRPSHHFVGAAQSPEWAPPVAKLNYQQPASSSGLNVNTTSQTSLPQCVLSLTPTYAVVSSTISFYIPCIIMLGLYIKLFACARRHVRNIQAISKAPAPIARQASQSAASTTTGCPPDHTRPKGARRTWLKFGRAPSAQDDKPAQVERRHTDERSSMYADENQLTQQLNLADIESELLDRLMRDEQQQQQQQQQPVNEDGHLSRPTDCAQQIQPQRPPSKQQQQQQSGHLATHKAAMTLGIIMGTFLFCWVPFFCLNIAKAFCQDCIPSSLFRAFTWIGYANSALNPIIYGIHNSEFRHAFNRIFFKHLNIKNSRYYINRRLSQDLRAASSRNSRLQRLKSQQQQRPAREGRQAKLSSLAASAHLAANVYEALTMNAAAATADSAPSL